MKKGYYNLSGTLTLCADCKNSELHRDDDWRPFNNAPEPDNCTECMVEIN